MKIGGFPTNNPFLYQNNIKDDKNSNTFKMGKKMKMMTGLQISNQIFKENNKSIMDIVKQINENVWKKNEQKSNQTNAVSAELKFLEEKTKTDRIASKIAKGEKVSKEEEEYLKTHDPEKLKNAKMANKQKKEVEKAMKNAKTKDEAMQIYSQAMAGALEMSKKNPDLGNLMAQSLMSIKVDRILHNKKNNILEIENPDIENLLKQGNGDIKNFDMTLTRAYGPDANARDTAEDMEKRLFEIKG